MKTKIAYLETEKRNYPLIFNLNVIEEIQEHYGSIENWGNACEGKKGEPKIKDVKQGIMLMINEAIDLLNEENETNDPLVTEKQVGRIITEIGLLDVTTKIKDLQKASMETGNEETKNT